MITSNYNTVTYIYHSEILRKIIQHFSLILFISSNYKSSADNVHLAL